MENELVRGEDRIGTGIVAVMKLLRLRERSVVTIAHCCGLTQFSSNFSAVNLCNEAKGRSNVC